jgi:hypothetical protein
VLTKSEAKHLELEDAGIAGEPRKRVAALVDRRKCSPTLGRSVPQPAAPQLLAEIISNADSSRERTRRPSTEAH